MMNGAAWQNAPDLMKLGLTLFSVGTFAVIAALWQSGQRKIAALLLVAAEVFVATEAFARDDGRYAGSTLKPWFDSLKSGKRPCCSDADSSSVQDTDWKSDKGKYRVRVPLNGFESNVWDWVDVPDEAVITEPNRAGRTMVWPLYGIGGVTIRCFMPGPMT